MSALQKVFICEVSSSDSAGVILCFCLLASKDIHVQSFDWTVVWKQIFKPNYSPLRNLVDIRFLIDQSLLLADMSVLM